jgi:hypothetical protein
VRGLALLPHFLQPSRSSLIQCAWRTNVSQNDTGLPRIALTCHIKFVPYVDLVRSPRNYRNPSQKTGCYRNRKETCCQLYRLTSIKQEPYVIASFCTTNIPFSSITPTNEFGVARTGYAGQTTDIHNVEKSGIFVICTFICVQGIQTHVPIIIKLEIITLF